MFDSVKSKPTSKSDSVKSNSKSDSVKSKSKSNSKSDSEKSESNSIKSVSMIKSKRNATDPKWDVHKFKFDILRMNKSSNRWDVYAIIDVNLPDSWILPDEENLCGVTNFNAPPRNTRIMKIPINPKTSVYNDPANIDNLWLEQQNQFIRSLTAFEIYTLIGYCHQSHEWVNAFNRNGAKWVPPIRAYSNIPILLQLIPIIASRQAKDLINKTKVYDYVNFSKLLDPRRLKSALDSKMQSIETSIAELTERFHASNTNLKRQPFFIAEWKNRKLLEDICMFLNNTITYEAMRDFTRDVYNIIDRAPMTTQKMVLFRGSRDEEGNTFKQQFMSTTLDLDVALAYAGDRIGKKYIHKITLMPGSKAIFLGGINPYCGDLEVLLDTSFLRKHPSNSDSASYQSVSALNPGQESKRHVKLTTFSPRHQTNVKI